jgi:AcrR family transcriptional regulator
MTQRRRGIRLDDAIMDAAWTELNEYGYSGLTLESVAKRAGTSRTVISRRWPNRNSLMVAAFARYLERNPIEVPDLGSLRDEVMALLRKLSERAQPSIIRLMLDMMEALIDEGTTMAVVKAQIVDSRSLMSEILERGIARGEVDPARLTPRVISVASDLARHEFMMTFAPLSEQAIHEIVDDVFLPLVRPHAGAS